VATSAGEIEVKLTLDADDFKKILNDSKSDLQETSDSMNAAVLGIGAAIAAGLAAIGAFLKSSLDSYAQYQTSVTRLTAALSAQGLAADSTVQHLTNLAQHLQDITGVSDNNIIAAQALLTTYGLQGATLDKATQAALDLSAAMGIDLERAAQLLGKAYDGNTASLSRYGIMINEHTDTSRKFAAVMDQVNQRFGGAAQAQAETYTGKLNIMKAAFEDFEKAIGQLLAGPAGALVVMMTSVIRTFTDWVSIMANIHSSLGSVGEMISGFVSTVMGPLLNGIFNLEFQLTAILDKIPFMHTSVAILNVDIFDQQQKLNANIAAWQKAMTQAKATTDSQKKGVEDVTAAVDDQTKGVADAAESQTKFVSDSMNEEAKLRSKLAADAKKEHEDFVASFITTEGDLWGFATQTSNSFFQGFGDGFAKMVIEGKNFGDSMKQVFQDMAEQIISYIVQMIAKLLVLFALEQATGVGAGIAGGGMIGGFFAEGGVINEPSIITGLRSGRKILAGESGPEVVTPAGGSGMNQTAAEMGGLPGSGGGGDITINIQGQFLEADSNSWNRLMREQIIPQIRRFTMSSPTGPFNRTRGVI
jgi:hypothetical protein